MTGSSGRRRRTRRGSRGPSLVTAPDGDRAAARKREKAAWKHGRGEGREGPDGRTSFTISCARAAWTQLRLRAGRRPSRVIDRSLADPDAHSVALTTEEEGVALLARGRSRRRARGVLLMQSSGVGNCINMLSLIKGGTLPLSHARQHARRVRRGESVAVPRWARRSSPCSRRWG